jgi:hypothetical protein
MSDELTKSLSPEHPNADPHALEAETRPSYFPIRSNPSCAFLLTWWA